MLRYRRYRVFLLFAACTVFLLWRFSTPATRERSVHAVDTVKHQLGLKEGSPERAKTSPASPQPPLRSKPKAADGVPETEPEKVPPPPIEDIAKPEQPLPPAEPAVKPSARPNLDSDNVAPPPGERISEGNGDRDSVRLVPAGPPAEVVEQVIAEAGVGRKEDNPPPTNAKPIRWIKPKEHFPVSTTIQLPSGSAQPIPRIQAVFNRESAAEKEARLEKLDAIKEAFLHAWNGYKENAWKMDELMPVSGGFKNPFNGWGATLIDSMDTMWMMGLKKEFEEAVEAVAATDFQQSDRNDIPVFETVIRYLGGLIGAYDVSGGRYRILLDKAVELAEVLIGVFDTPNRMPIMYYHWKPAFTSQPHRASTNVVLAELGTLAVEFTRLAQITKEPKYYDAIARITDALQLWQNNTRIPGLWPIRVDASGCLKNQGSEYHRSTILHDSDDQVPLNKPPPVMFSNGKGPVDGKESKAEVGTAAPHADSDGQSSQESSERNDFAPLEKPEPLVFDIKPSPAAKRMKRQLESPDADWAMEESTSKPFVPTVPDSPVKAYINRGGQWDASLPEVTHLPECPPAGLQSAYAFGMEEFTFGSMADSAYEYFPKEFVLLGGRVEQYREMYNWAADVGAEKLFFRVMIPDEKREVLVSGALKVYIPYGEEDGEQTETFLPQGSHLTCFVGGMYALGAKVFDRPKDLDLASKLTDGCIWAYESTATGIMPEHFMAVACEEKTYCPWNETKWWEELDPSAEVRQERYQSDMEAYRADVAARESASRAAAMAEATATKPEAEESMAIQTSPPAPYTETAPKEDTLGWDEPASEREAEDRALRKRSDPEPFPEPQAKRGSTDPDSVAAEIDLATKNSLAGAVRDSHSTEDSSGSGSGGAGADAWGADEDGPTATRPAAASRPAAVLPPFPLYSPQPPLSREAHVRQLLATDALPPGMVQRSMDRSYKLRPEALESVFYMHRLTAEPRWRAKAWPMVQAVLGYTRAPFGHSAVRNVLRGRARDRDRDRDRDGPADAHPVPPRDPDDDAGGWTDVMESFWLAETLKYAWLLFVDEAEWSLDEWVLNTEAHLFRREDAGPWKG